ncbi:MAG: hypothetical protein QM762_18240 [Chryseolinea sp.]
MKISGTVLKQLCDTFHFPIENDPAVLFAFRGCLPSDVHQSVTKDSILFRNSDEVNRTRVNYNNPRCTIGIWDRVADKIALFPGSTLPSKDYVRRHPSSVSSLNVLCPGCYHLRKGIHPRNERGFQPHSALLMDGFGIVGIPHVNEKTGFSSRIATYDVVRPGDNLHAGRMEPLLNVYSSVLNLKYSSSGCITVVGQPAEYLQYNHRHTAWNSWTTFIESEILTNQKNFHFLLFNFDDLNATTVSKSNLIRYGSKRHEVSEIQYLLGGIVNANTGKLYYSGDLHCSFSDITAVSYFTFFKDYFSSIPGWEIQPQSFFTKTKHFRNRTKHFKTPLTPSENVIHRSSANY